MDAEHQNGERREKKVLLMLEELRFGGQRWTPPGRDSAQRVGWR